MPRKLYKFAAEMGVDLRFEALFGEGFIFKKEYVHVAVRSDDKQRLVDFMENVRACIEEWSHPGHLTGISGYGTDDAGGTSYISGFGTENHVSGFGI